MSHFGIAVFTKTNKESELEALLEKYNEADERYFEVADGEGRELEDVYEEMQEDYPELKDIDCATFFFEGEQTVIDEHIKKFEAYLDERGWSFDGSYGFYGPVYNPQGMYDWYDTNGRFWFYKKDGSETTCCLASEIDPEKFKAIDFVDEDGEWHDNGVTSTYWFQTPDEEQYTEAAAKLKDAAERGLYVWCIDCHQ